MSLIRRLSRPFALLFVLIVITTCQSQSAVDSRLGGPCTGMSTNANAPIVCVDDSARKLTVSPDPVTVNSRVGGGPVTLQWFTSSGGGDLQIDVREGCVTDVSCNKSGHCSAHTMSVTAEKTCKYDVWINGGNHDRLDPEVKVVPCCGG